MNPERTIFYHRCSFEEVPDFAKSHLYPLHNRMTKVDTDLPYGAVVCVVWHQTVSMRGWVQYNSRHAVSSPMNANDIGS